jgi:hypothetical protein
VVIGYSQGGSPAPGRDRRITVLRFSAGWLSLMAFEEHSITAWSPHKTILPPQQSTQHQWTQAAASPG